MWLAGSGELLPGAVFLILLAAAAAPVLAVKVPGMVDYPNHLARMYAIGNIHQDPLLARYYAIDWRLIPNLAMDVVVPALARYGDVFLAGRVFVLATMLLMLSGPFAIEAALFGRVSPWPLIGFVFIYNWIFFYGFVNYLFGVGCALWGIAAWIGLRQRGPLLRLGVALAFALLLFASHLDAAGIYGLAILSYEAWRLRQNGVPSARQAAVDIAVFVLPLVLILGLAIVSPTTATPVWLKEWTVRSKLEGLFYIVKNFKPAADLAIGGVVGLAVIWGVLTRRLELHGAALYVFVAFALVFLAMPARVLGSFQADSRLPVAALFVLIGMVRLRAPSRAATTAFCAGVTVLSALRFGIVGETWHDFAADVADVERSLTVIPPGSKILTTRAEVDEVLPVPPLMYAHLPALALAERSSFVALAFTDPAKQVLSVRPAYRAIAAYEGIPPEIGKVVRGEPDLSATPPDAGDVAYYRDWRHRFDYVYVLFGTGAPPAPELSLVYRGRHFELYSVAKAEHAVSASPSPSPRGP
jgi:hypothetical protein